MIIVVSDTYATSATNASASTDLHLVEYEPVVGSFVGVQWLVGLNDSTAYTRLLPRLAECTLRGRLA